MNINLLFPSTNPKNLVIQGALLNIKWTFDCCVISEGVKKPHIQHNFMILRVEKHINTHGEIFPGNIELTVLSPSKTGMATEHPTLLQMRAEISVPLEGKKNAHFIEECRVNTLNLHKEFSPFHITLGIQVKPGEKRKPKHGSAQMGIPKPTLSLLDTFFVPY